jgi:homoserine dehydrogenase
MDEKRYGVALIGAGTVGGAVAQQIRAEADMILAKTGVRPVLLRVVEKNLARVRELGIPESLVCPLDEALADPKVDIVVELVGGTGFARTAIEAALRAGKPVVTANKALLAESGPELFALARQKGLWISFEASCEGAVPIIRALLDGVVANRIDALYGIVNGTCNHILTAMSRAGQSYAEALADAQRAGLAEADPSLDVKGLDSAHKLAILASLAFGQGVRDGSFPVSGVDSLDVKDLRYGAELGYVVKLLAAAERRPEGLSLRVRPHFISLDHPLAWVSGAFNAVSVYGHSSGHSMHYGRGAGGLPTSSAILSDIVSSALGTAKILFSSLRLFPDQCPEAVLLDPDANVSRYYLRLNVADVPGVLGKVAGILGDHGISISSALQKEAGRGEGASNAVAVVVTTHEALEGSMRRAQAEIAALKESAAPPVAIPIMDEYREFTR